MMSPGSISSPTTSEHLCVSTHKCSLVAAEKLLLRLNAARPVAVVWGAVSYDRWTTFEILHAKTSVDVVFLTPRYVSFPFAASQVDFPAR